MKMYDTSRRRSDVPRRKEARSVEARRFAASESVDLSYAEVSFGSSGPVSHDVVWTRLGEILLRAKKITSSQLEYALELQRQHGGKLGEILVSLGWLDKETLEAALAAQAAHKPL